MKKYLSAIKLSWYQNFAFRADFWFARLRNLILLFTLYFLYTSVYSSGYTLLNFTKNQTVTYVLVSSLIYAYVFVYTDNAIAGNIGSGQLNFNIIKPINYPVFEFVKTTGARFFNLICSMFELSIFFVIFRPNFYLIKLELVPIFLISIFLCSTIFFIFNLYAGTAAFILQNAYGPRFLLRQFLELFTGRFFPLSILPIGILVLVKNSPLWYVVYQPLEIYFSEMSFWDSTKSLVAPIFWLLVLVVIHKIFWDKAIKSYEGYGI